MMNADVGSIHRPICIIIGAATLGLFFVLQGPAHWFALLGVVPLATGSIGLLSRHLPFSISTRHIR